MASVRSSTAALLLLPLLSVVVLAMAVRWVCRVASRKLSALARAFPSGGEHSASVSGVDMLLPVVLYNNKRSGGEEELDHCVLCLSVIEEGSEVRELKCRHLFHRPCLDRWLLLAATCPLCRLSLKQDDDQDDSSDMMLFMACVHSRSTWLWPS